MEILVFLGGFLVGALCVFIPFKVINKNNETSKNSQEEIFEKISDIEEARRQISRSVSRGYALKGLVLKGR